jgi:hypothetical protein
VVQYNHGLNPDKAKFFICHKNIDVAVKRMLKLNNRAGIHTNKNFNSLVVEIGREGVCENLPFGKKDERNFIEKEKELQFGNGGAQALCDYFSRIQKQNEGFYYVMDMDDDNRLRNAFRADA